MRHWSRYGVNGALEMTFMNYYKKNERCDSTIQINGLQQIAYLLETLYQVELDLKTLVFIKRQML